MQALATHLAITLLYLPSYSPNLNRIARLWKFIKRRATLAAITQHSPTFRPPSWTPSTDCLPATHHNWLSHDAEFSEFREVSLLAA